MDIRDDATLRAALEQRARDRVLQRDNALRRRRLAAAASALSNGGGVGGDKGVPTCTWHCGAAAGGSSRPTTTGTTATNSHSEGGLSAAAADAASVVSSATAASGATAWSSAHSRRASGCMPAVVRCDLTGSQRGSYAHKQDGRARSLLLPQRPRVAAAALSTDCTASTKEFVEIELAVQTWADCIEAPNSAGNKNALSFQTDCHDGRGKCSEPAPAATAAAAAVMREASRGTESLPPLPPKRQQLCAEVTPMQPQAERTTVASPRRGKSSLQRSCSAPSPGARCKVRGSAEPKSIVKRFPLKRQLRTKNVHFSSSTKDNNTNGSAGALLFTVRDDDDAAREQGKDEGELARPYSHSFVDEQCAKAAEYSNEEDFGEAQPSTRYFGQCAGTTASHHTPCGDSPTKSESRRESRYRLSRLPLVSDSGTFHTGVTLEERALEKALEQLDLQLPPAQRKAVPIEQQHLQQDKMRPRAFQEDEDSESEPEEAPKVAAMSSAFGNPTHRTMMRWPTECTHTATRPSVESRPQQAARCESLPDEPPVMDLNRNPLIRRARKKVAVAAPLGHPRTNVVLPHTAPKNDPKLLPRRDLRSGKRVSHVGR